MNVKNSPYAKFLEELIETIMKSKPDKIGVVYKADDGNTYSHYFGAPYPEEKAMMGYRMTADAMFAEVMANADMVVREAEELQESEEE